MSRWEYKNDLRELHKKMSLETDKKVIAEHTCAKCGDFAFKDELEAYGMCWNDYEIHSPSIASQEESAMSGFNEDVSKYKGEQL